MITEQELRAKRLALLIAVRDAERRTSDVIAIPDSQLPADPVILMGMVQAITWMLGEDPRNEPAWIHDNEAPGRKRLKTERQLRVKRERLQKKGESGIIHMPHGAPTADERALAGMLEALTWALAEHVREPDTWASDITKPVENYTFDDWVDIGAPKEGDSKYMDIENDALDRIARIVRKDN